MVRTTKSSRKLLSSSCDFFSLKLIMLVGPVLFISINGINGAKVYDGAREGTNHEISFVPVDGLAMATAEVVTPHDTPTTIGQVFNGTASPNNGTVCGGAKDTIANTMTADQNSFIGDAANRTTSNGERILSRRRRYLVFPEGSSIQVVADTVVAIVDHQSLLVVGLTSAMAWELPYDPFYPNEELPEAYEEGRLPLLQLDFEAADAEDDDDDDDTKKGKKKQHRRKDNSTAIHYSAKKKSSKKPAVQQTPPAEWNSRPPIQYFNQPSSPYADNVQPLHSANHYASQPQQPHPYYTNYGSDKFSKFDGYYGGGNRIPAPNMDGSSNKLNYYLSYANKLFRDYNAQLNRSDVGDSSAAAAVTVENKKSDVKKSNSAKKKPKRKPKPTTEKFYDVRKHFIHPVFKRSTTGGKPADQWAQLPALDKFDLTHHRRTRHSLYQRIEKFLEAQGNHGMDCIMKSLCETGQRSDDDEPGSMVVELMRAIFTLPIVPDSTDNPLHHDFDEAHNTKEDCSKLFPRCKGSIWKNDYTK